jgi:hypothetical protein
MLRSLTQEGGGQLRQVQSGKFVEFGGWKSIIWNAVTIEGTMAIKNRKILIKMGASCAQNEYGW